MPDYNALAVFVASVGGTFATIIYATQKSKCSTIKTPCISCDRNPEINCTDLENQLSNINDTTDRRESEQPQPLAQSAPVAPTAIAGDRLSIRSDV